MGFYLLVRADESVAVMQTVGGTTPEQALAKWPPNVRAQIISVQEIDEAEIPAERTFRNAWCCRSGSGKKLEVDMDKAREVWKSQIRVARAPRLLELDVEFFKANEVGDEAQKLEITVKKQLLRNIPEDPSIQKAQTPDELKAFWPAELGPPPVTPAAPVETPKPEKEKPRDENPSENKK